MREGGRGVAPHSAARRHKAHRVGASQTLIALAAVAALAALLVPTALAARVSVRIEGRFQPLFGSLTTRFEAGPTALSALDGASGRGEFYYHVTQSSFGPYVDQIGKFAAEGSNGWTYKVNGISPPVGADKYQLKAGDRVLWYWAAFGPTGGPPTLLLTRTRRDCYRVVAENDQGADSVPAGAFLNVDGRHIRTRRGRACVGRHRGIVMATAVGAVRSNALT
ncbi:MAG TPA: DUF4430 domain-containing protein [Gaiellaceae bacterium]|nr:DUF4430 domain-containing protein [Gaiellaceae bacterium]